MKCVRIVRSARWNDTSSNDTSSNDMSSNDVSSNDTSSNDTSSNEVSLLYFWGQFLANRVKLLAHGVHRIATSSVK